MLRLGNVAVRDCQGIHRRELLRLGAVGIAGLTLADLLGAADSSQQISAKSCILIYLAGGPSQFETLDPKPAAPVQIRGPWGAIASRVPGCWFGEMLPQLAGLADKFALIRSLQHTNSLHQPWPMLTGNMQSRISLASAVVHLTSTSATRLPDFVNLGPRLSIGAGSLGPRSEPLEIANPLHAQESLARFVLPLDLPLPRLNDRDRLRKAMDGLFGAVDPPAAVTGYERNQQRALDMLTSTAVRDAFDVVREPRPLRDRYGANHFGQSCLLARRLIEAGTRLVQINWANREDGFAVGWDVHGDDQTGLVRMEQQLCPRFDQGLSALLRDLDQRGLLESTLVIATGEFGRTPTISRLGGRDHWPYCFSALLAGGGVPGGTVVGASDKQGAYPTDRAASPADLAATIFALLGVDPNRDDRLRPSVFEGHAISDLRG